MNLPKSTRNLVLIGLVTAGSIACGPEECPDVGNVLTQTDSAVSATLQIATDPHVRRNGSNLFNSIGKHPIVDETSDTLNSGDAYAQVGTTQILDNQRLVLVYKNPQESTTLLETTESDEEAQLVLTQAAYVPNNEDIDIIQGVEKRTITANNAGSFVETSLANGNVPGQICEDGGHAKNTIREFTEKLITALFPKGKSP